MKELLLDASNWKTKDDVYDAIFCVVRSPEWHGRNLDALRDSIATGQINKIEVPYRLVVRNARASGADAKAMLQDFVKLIHDLAGEGCPVEIHVE